MKKRIKILKDKYRDNQEILEIIESLSELHIQERADAKTIRSILAHELKSPLNGIVGYSNLLLKDGTLTPVQKKYLGIIEKSAWQLEDLIGLLYQSGLSYDELRINSEKIRLPHLITNIIEEKGYYLDEHKLSFNLMHNIVDGQSETIHGNKKVFQKINSTLLGNSLGYAVSGTNIDIGIKRNDVGDLEMIIENFCDGSKRHDAPGMGKGKGLPFVRQIIKTLNGELGEYEHSEKLINLKDYNVTDKWGFEDTSDDIEGDEGIYRYSVKISIPEKELQYYPEKPYQKQLRI